MCTFQSAKFSVSSSYLACGFGGTVVLVSLVVTSDWNCILRCRPSENSKLLPLLWSSMNFWAPWRWPHPSKPFERRHQHTAHTEWPLPIGFLVEYLVLPCYCMQWITKHSPQAGNKINRVRFSNKQLSSNVFGVTFLRPCWFKLHHFNFTSKRMEMFTHNDSSTLALALNQNFLSALNFEL